MPDHGVASWGSANDKPTTGAGSKPVSGDAAEQRLKTEVMQLPSRDRRRLKDLSQNEVRRKEPAKCLYFDHITSSILKMHLLMYLGSIVDQKPLDKKIQSLQVLVA